MPGHLERDDGSLMPVGVGGSHQMTYAEGEASGREEVRDEILAILDAPETDDPVDTLRAVALAVGLDEYDYFDRRGQWVRYPDTEG